MKRVVRKLIYFYMIFAMALGAVSAGFFAVQCDQSIAYAASVSARCNASRDFDGYSAKCVTVDNEDIAYTAGGVKLTQRRGSKVYDSDYDKYSTNYVYNQLSSAKREVWDNLNDLCLDILTNSGDLDNSNIGYVAYDSDEMTSKQACYLAYLFMLSNPQYYFLKSEFWYGSDTAGNMYVTIIVYDAFVSGADRAVATVSFFEEVESRVSEGKAISGTQEKVNYFYNLVTDNVSYASNTFDQSAYSAVCLGQTVCAGYSMYFSMLCNAADIDCVCITSKKHEWNKVCIDSNWYNVDVTFGDSGTNGSPYYDYYLRSDKAYKSLSYYAYHKAQSFWKKYLITCKLDSGSSMYERGSLPAVSDKTAKPVVKYKKSGSKYVITITCKTDGAIIYYTKNGAKPTVAAGKSFKYTKKFTVDSLKKAKKVKAIAVTPGYKVSKVAKAKKS